MNQKQLVVGGLQLKVAQLQLRVAGVICKGVMTHNNFVASN